MKLECLKTNFWGDSITEGRSVVDIPNNRYDNVLKELAGLQEVRRRHHLRPVHHQCGPGPKAPLPAVVKIS